MDKIQEIQERLDKIAPGKWYEDHGQLYSEGKFLGIVCHYFADIDFFSNAPDDIKYLIEEVGRLKKYISMLQSTVKSLTKKNEDLSDELVKYKMTKINNFENNKTCSLCAFDLNDDHCDECVNQSHWKGRGELSE